LSQKLSQKRPFLRHQPTFLKRHSFLVWFSGIDTERLADEGRLAV
jgi:hypothetical protein